MLIRLQININVFKFLDDESKARHPLFISKNNTPEQQICYNLMNITLQSLTFPVFLII